MAVFEEATRTRDVAQRLSDRHMEFEPYADVILTRDIAECGLRSGDIGTVVELHSATSMADEGYSVEFFDMTGNTVAVVTVPASALRPPTQADRPAARREQPTW